MVRVKKGNVMYLRYKKYSTLYLCIYMFYTKLQMLLHKTTDCTTNNYTKPQTTHTRNTQTKLVVHKADTVM